MCALSINYLPNKVEVVENFWLNIHSKSSRPEVFCKNIALKNIEVSQENTCARISFLEVCSFIKKETLARVFCCEFCNIFKSNFSYRTKLGGCFCHLQVTLCKVYASIDTQMEKSVTHPSLSLCSFCSGLIVWVHWRLMMYRTLNIVKF